MITFNDLFIDKPRFIGLTPGNRTCYKDDILELTINLDENNDVSAAIKLKVVIQKETHLGSTILVLPNKDKPLDAITASAALLGYEDCHQYQRKHINLVVCIVEM